MSNKITCIMKTSNTSRIDEDYIQNDSKCTFTTTPRIDKIQENDITAIHVTMSFTIFKWTHTNTLLLPLINNGQNNLNCSLLY